MTRTRLLLVAAVAVAGLVLAPGAVAAAGDVDVSQAEDGSATVTVTENGSAVAGAAVAVSATDENGTDGNATDGNATYAGAGDYETDENGTVALPAPVEPVDVTVTASWDDESASVAGTLEPADGAAGDDGGRALSEPFGSLVSSFVHDLQNESENDTGLGPAVATFVLENNPAADRIPDHAGPPAHVTGEAGNETAGPGNGTAAGKFTPVDVGPPEHAGPDGEDDGGPPEHAGGGQPDDEGPPEDGG